MKAEIVSNLSKCAVCLSWVVFENVIISETERAKLCPKCYDWRVFDRYFAHFKYENGEVLLKSNEHDFIAVEVETNWKGHLQVVPRP